MFTIDEIRKELGEYIDKADDTIIYTISRSVEKLAIRHFGRLPYLNQLTDKLYEKNDDSCDFKVRTHIGGLVSCEDYEDEPNYVEFFNSECDEEEFREKYKNIDFAKTVENIIKAFPDAIVYSVRACKIDEKLIFHDKFIYHDGVFYMDEPELPQEIYDCVAEKEYKPQIRWILRNSRGAIENKYMEISPKGNIQDNYNDDFMAINDKITSLLYNDESCIMILHGKPGTGKSSYIRDLIANNPDVKFYWIDSSMFAYIDSSEFIEFLSTCKNSVFVLEDSEVLLKSRETGGNIAMQTLLNISDGILGDSLKLKFICTFNTELPNIDKALLRKGRLKIKYEFKELEKAKVEKLFDKLGLDKTKAKSMPLCDVYNFLEDNGNKDTRPKIGF